MDCIVSIIEENPESKEIGLWYLCEFTENCKFTMLATHVLHLLGQEGPKTNNPSTYICFIYDHLVLEHEEVRAGAVSALAKSGAQKEEMLLSILVLLKRCVMNNDSEVRDQATYYLNILGQKQKVLNSGYILNGLFPSRVWREFCSGTEAAKQPEKVAATWQEIFQEQLEKVPEFHGWGPLFKASLEPVTLTESETEYVITAPNTPSLTT